MELYEENINWENSYNIFKKQFDELNDQNNSLKAEINELKNEIQPEIPPVFITTPWNPWFCWIFAKIALLYFITTKSLAHPKNIEFIGFLVVVIIFSGILGYKY